MATNSVTVFDGNGNVLEQYTVDAPEPLSEPDLVSVSRDLADARDRLTAAEEALDHLIITSLDADLGSL